MKMHLCKDSFKMSRKDRATQVVMQNDVPVIVFTRLIQTGIVEHGFSTRAGGVSQGAFASMNLSFTRGDRRGDVEENFKRFASAVKMDYNQMVMADQTHTVNIRVVDEKDAGKGFVYEKDYADIDGLVTDQPGLPLVTLYADCVPLYFVDTERKVIGLSHSGWKGTVGRIGAHTVRVMQEQFGCQPQDILVAVGPSICRSCYEISEDVADRFKENFTAEQTASFLDDKENGKYQLDLWKANEVILTEAGILQEKITVTDICTCCNHELMWSHRKTGDARGSLAAFLMLKK